MKEYIVPIDETALDYDETFIGFIRKQEELTRCKDCKHWQYESCFVESEEGDADSIILDRFAFDFCSRAERKEE